MTKEEIKDINNDTQWVENLKWASTPWHWKRLIMVWHQENGIWKGINYKK